MAPEQLGGGAIGPPTDQYSLAAMTYYLLAGRKLFDSESISELSYRIVHQPPPPATQVNSSLPKPVDRVFARALSKRPEERFPSCREFVEALSLPFEAQAAPLVQSHSKRNIQLVFAAVIFACLCVVAVILALWSRGGHSSNVADRTVIPKSASQPVSSAPAPNTPPKKESARVISPQTASPKTLAFADIYFEEGVRDALSPAQMSVLRTDAEVLKRMFQQRRGLTVRIEAYSQGAQDSSGSNSERADYDVSLDRAEFVRQKLIDLGAPGAQLVTAGLGRGGNRAHLAPQE
jgi:serine/threonine protein kinase